MEYIVSAHTDAGICKGINQDSLTVKIAQSCIGNLAFAVLCDGMGGLEQGEVASADMVRRFSQWFRHRLPLLLAYPLEESIIRQEWETIIRQGNEKIMCYGKKQGIYLGTTIVAGLFTDNGYYIMNVGDSRAYELSDRIRAITTDQTIVQRELQEGILTQEQARHDPRRSVLLQCVGASEKVYPDMFFGRTKRNAVYMFCSDGFWHRISEEEIYQYLGPEAADHAEAMEANARYLVELNKRRLEKDNISVAMIRTY